MRLLPRIRRCAAALALLLIAAPSLAPSARAQIEGGATAPAIPATIVHATASSVEIRAGGSASAEIELAIESPWHINANPPSPDYMIPTQVSVRAAAGVTAGKPIYPAAQSLKVGFDDQPLSVYTGHATIRLPLTASAQAVNGRHVLKGTVRFQSCNDQVCMAPATAPFELAVTVSGGAAAGAVTAAESTGAIPADSGAAPGDTSGLSGARGPGGPGGLGAEPLRPAGGPAIVANPIAEAITKGGLVAFLTLFVLGLALNLTPCVYPMLGVTVSIFGARSAAPTIQVFGSALLYVLGMATMYSALGVAASLTGGLFGAFLQSPWVLAGIGALLILMALSMFGLYELQPPAWLLTRLGGSGTTSAIGVFLSGLVVGVFAAPCVGPPVVALLAIVGAKADPWFGFISFFTLALGLGAPYLVLGTFSNLLQRLPRSGDWMVWVKKVFGVILIAVGLFYAGIAFSPKLAMWVAPAALLVGGLYLGFLEKSASARRGFTLLKRATGIAAVAGGVWMLASAPKQTVTFQAYDAALVRDALASGKPVILDFAADWCIPCHELERNTFSDPRVIAAMREFAAFQVDLTHSDSPEVMARVKEFRIQGVPTVVFLTPRGEVEAARFSGFLPPERFLERVRTASDWARSAGS